MRLAIFVSLFLFFAGQAVAASPSYVQHSSGGGSTTSISCDLTSTTSGNGLIISIAIISTADAAATISSPAISGETIVTALAPDYYNGFYATQAIYVTKQLGSGGTKTFTGTIGGATMGQYDCTILEVSGQDTTDFFNATNCVHDTWDFHEVYVTATDNNFLYGQDITVIYEPTQGTGFSIINEPNIGSNYIEGEYKNDSGTAGSKQIRFETTGSTLYYACGIAIKPSGGPPPSKIRHKSSIS